VSRLELRIPPDVVWALVAGLMWLAAVSTPRVVVPSLARIGIGAVLTILGVVAMVSARAALERASTTWQPMTPGQTTRLVTTGVYGFSRNPMYLGMLLVMLGWGVLLASPAAMVVSAVFVLYIDRFQIMPEERVLSAVLGQEFLEYLARVRRWI
jgi:protein-S-isoprenylcysteine O-methyltransferase Ste14